MRDPRVSSSSYQVTLNTTNYKHGHALILSADFRTYATEEEGVVTVG